MYMSNIISLENYDHSQLSADLINIQLHLHLDKPSYIYNRAPPVETSQTTWGQHYRCLISIIEAITLNSEVNKIQWARDVWHCTAVSTWQWLKMASKHNTFIKIEPAWCDWVGYRCCINWCHSIIITMTTWLIHNYVDCTMSMLMTVSRTGNNYYVWYVLNNESLITTCTWYIVEIEYCVYLFETKRSYVAQLDCGV